MLRPAGYGKRNDHRPVAVVEGCLYADGLKAMNSGYHHWLPNSRDYIILVSGDIVRAKERLCGKLQLKMVTKSSMRLKINC